MYYIKTNKDITISQGAPQTYVWCVPYGMSKGACEKKIRKEKVRKFLNFKKKEIQLYSLLLVYTWYILTNHICQKYVFEHFDPKFKCHKFESHNRPIWWESRLT